MAEKKRGPGRPPGSKNKKSSSGSSKKKSETSPQVQQAVQKLEMRLEAKAQLKDEILGIIVVALGVFLIVALQTSAAGMVGEDRRMPIQWDDSKGMVYRAGNPHQDLLLLGKEVHHQGNTAT